MLARVCVRFRTEATLLKAKAALTDSIMVLARLDDSRGQIISHALLSGIERRLGNYDDALLAVYEADRLAADEECARFRRPLASLRHRVETQMSSATRACSTSSPCSATSGRRALARPALQGTRCHAAL
jgi:hypothetical protein